MERTTATLELYVDNKLTGEFGQYEIEPGLDLEEELQCMAVYEPNKKVFMQSLYTLLGEGYEVIHADTLQPGEPDVYYTFKLDNRTWYGDTLVLFNPKTIATRTLAVRYRIDTVEV